MTYTLFSVVIGYGDNARVHTTHDTLAAALATITRLGGSARLVAS